MKAEIIAIGTEILLGEIADTNSAYIAAALPRLGIDLYWISTVGDNPARMHEALDRAWKRSDLVFTTGGLGPSEGDITRSAIASLVGETVTIDPGVVERLKARFQRTGREMTPSNIKQAGIIPSATFIPNSRGTAPGWWLEKNGHILIAMPGPPGEVHTMWQNEVLPRLKKLKTGSVIVSRTVKIWGISESLLNEMLLPMFSSANPTLAIYAKADGIHIRIAAKAENEEKARELIAPVEAKVRTAVEAHLMAHDDALRRAILIEALNSGAGTKTLHGRQGAQESPLHLASIRVHGSTSLLRSSTLMQKSQQSSHTLVTNSPPGEEDKEFACTPPRAGSRRAGIPGESGGVCSERRTAGYSRSDPQAWTVKNGPSSRGVRHKSQCPHSLHLD